MDSQPTFSIVITSYNYGHFLASALESVLLQNRSDIQILLIDDASTDNTPEVARKFLEHIQYVRNERNLGAGGAWGVGLGLSRGKYLIKLDADDELLAGHLDALQKAFEADEKVGMVFASVLLRAGTSEDMEVEYVTDEDRTLNAENFRRKLLECFRFRMPGCALRREATVGYEGPDPKLFQIHDWEYILKVTQGYKATLLKKPTAIYRLHDSSITSVARFDDRLYNDVKRWLAIANVQGERFINADDRKILIGSCSCLLLYGFGSKLNPVSYVRFVPIYFRTLFIALKGGRAQVGRMHRALYARMLQKPESGT